MSRKRLFFDMDGVIVDFHSGVAKLSEETKKIYEGRLLARTSLQKALPLSDAYVRY